MGEGDGDGVGTKAVEMSSGMLTGWVSTVKETAAYRSSSKVVFPRTVTLCGPSAKPESMTIAFRS